MEVTTHFHTTTPSQHQRGHFHEAVALSLKTGAKDAGYFEQFGLSKGDLGRAMSGKRIEGVADQARETIISEIENAARVALGWDPHL